ncbi:hypothetical protein [Pedobacter deserti]|uniref:hypothetical protein n=1 Tax=Pedobacter deserti TaxID=2817382 RepID=UPI00210B4638|nr:hypothetical protein [Pedobacter sp. SYSU D00382]
METNKPKIDKLQFRAFRAVDERQTCLKFVEGHTKVLEIFGITQITSAKIDWMLNPNVYLVVVTAEDDDRILAGGRIQIADDKFPLPIEDAVGYIDDRIYKMVMEENTLVTGECCGLWNSWEVAGLGIGSIFLGRTCVAITEQLKMKSLFALCAPATYRNCIRTGFRVIDTIGNKGKFYYPKEDLTATALIIDDVITLDNTFPEERGAIMELRNNLVMDKTVETKHGPIDIHFDLRIKGITS